MPDHFPASVVVVDYMILTLMMPAILLTSSITDSGMSLSVSKIGTVYHRFDIDVVVAEYR